MTHTATPKHPPKQAMNHPAPTRPLDLVALLRRLEQIDARLTACLALATPRSLNR